MVQRWIGLAAALLATGCAADFEAPQEARLSSAPGASGYVIVGLATQSYKREFGRSTQALVLDLDRPTGSPVSVSRNGCGSFRGFYGSKPCELSKLDRRVLEVPAGDWVPGDVAEQFNNWGTRKTLRDKAPPGTPVHVGPGEVVYIGDFTFASDYDAQEIKLTSHGRDDAAAAQALAAYPGLRAASIVYRDPTRTP